MTGYGFCPTCYSPGVQRDRRICGDDECQNGHTYPSSESLTRVNAINRLNAQIKMAKRRLKEFIEANPEPGESTGFADICR